MADITIAQRARAEQALNKKVKFEGVIMTKREWCDLIMNDGYLPQEETRNRVNYKRGHMNKLMGQDLVDEYMKKCEEIVPCFVARKEKSSYEISKAEFDYMKTKQL